MGTVRKAGRPQRDENLDPLDPLPGGRAHPAEARQTITVTRLPFVQLLLVPKRAAHNAGIPGVLRFPAVVCMSYAVADWGNDRACAMGRAD